MEMTNEKQLQFHLYIKTTLRNVQEKPKTPTEKKESIMLKEAKARYLIRSILLYDISLLLPTPLNNFTVDFFLLQ